MIETPTVLILGAGASRPYGFWLGRELLFKVVEGLDVNGDINNRLRQVDFDAQELSTFQHSTAKVNAAVRGRLPRTPSGILKHRKGSHDVRFPRRSAPP